VGVICLDDDDLIVCTGLMMPLADFKFRPDEPGVLVSFVDGQTIGVDVADDLGKDFVEGGGDVEGSAATDRLDFSRAARSCS
jgi:hypothetical protein